MFFIFSSPKNVKELADICKRPWKLALWLWHRIWYKSDISVHGVKDYWQTPDETLRLRSGDCEDFALLVYAVLKEWGYQPYLIAGYNASIGHLEAVFTENNKWYSIANKGLRRYHVASYRGVGPKLLSGCKIWRVYDNKHTVIEEYVKVGDSWKRMR